MSPGAVAARVVVTAPEQLPAAADPQVPAGSDQLATDQLATGQLATGQLATEQLATGQPLAVGRLPAGLLTERERQVAALIAGGLSNQAIASELQIRPSTAARHVANIFAKLGFNSRGQVQAWMADGHAGG
jgi:DNA-binding NarL/FixJ family response regulator